ncbi:hypothetical protein C922_05220 [Plasmodium inui San Antonio 1]|uniref:Uncharacterized protein n=1 Tax=Plasmodium inui San Antonio 1 TaxID=1237626 RepID=W7A5M9_9APIC|nr:hypothetical protein C922_05220 [Plasmodium inui San Antonio 1]EUD64399.1 hypothetical protein C922_05220 [Plasmodium inui San Antonio 1]
MGESSKRGLSGDVGPRNSFVHNIRNIQIVMITHNMDILQWILQKITYIKQRVLTTGISIIIKYHRELSVPVQETLSMRNKTFSTKVRSRAKYLLNLQGGISEHPYATAATEGRNLSKYPNTQNPESSESIRGNRYYNPQAIPRSHQFSVPSNT